MRLILALRDWLYGQPIIRHGLCGNTWLWAHVMIANMVAKLLTFTALPSGLILAGCVVGMVLYEAWQFLYDYDGDWQRVIAVYGNRQAYWMDATGDVVFPALLLVIWMI